MDVVDKLNENDYHANYSNYWLGGSYYHTALEIFKPVEDEEEPMVDIISANEASEIARKHDNSDKVVEEFLKMADGAIRDYASKGKYSIKLSCLGSNQGIVYEKIKKALTDEGYNVVLEYPFINIKW
jgi:hypothetical protein